MQRTEASTCHCTSEFDIGAFIVAPTKMLRSFPQTVIFLSTWYDRPRGALHGGVQAQVRVRCW